MKELGIRTAIALAIAIAIVTSIPLLAQQATANVNAHENASATAGGANASNSANANANGNATREGVEGGGSAGATGKTTYAPTAGGFGDQAASRAWEMTSVTGELEGNLDSKKAKVGDAVVLKTMQKVQTSDGTVIPKGTRLVGHVTQVQAYSKETGASQMNIAFDRAELKNGQNIAIHTLIRSVSPAPSVAAGDAFNNEDAMDAPMGGAGRMGGGPVMGGGRAGGALGGVGGVAGGAAGSVGGMADGTLDRTADATGTIAGRAGAGVGAAGSAVAGPVETAGHGDLNLDAGAHGAGAARGLLHPTGIPGVMLAGSSTSSGLLTASKRNIQIESGSRMVLGIVADK
jgi:hypothetical protein